MFEKSRFPRHKVCGEFLSPEIIPLLEQLGVWEDITARGPAKIRRLVLHFRSSEKRCALGEPALGLSRYALDHILFQKATAMSARAVHEYSPSPAPAATILAHGRKNSSVRGGRLFGFKAHFDGPANDAIELFFFGNCYVGLNAVEGGVTNVCGLGPEDLLRAHDFDIDAVVNSCESLSERLRPLRRQFRWLTVGPLVFQNRFKDPAISGQYACGDALSFVDPFTGSGLLSALATGRLAGIAAAEGKPVEEYLGECRRLLQRPFQFASLFRNLLANGWGERLSRFAPGRLLVALTRPHRIA